MGEQCEGLFGVGDPGKVRAYMAKGGGISRLWRRLARAPKAEAVALGARAKAVCHRVHLLGHRARSALGFNPRAKAVAASKAVARPPSSHLGPEQSHRISSSAEIGSRAVRRSDLEQCGDRISSSAEIGSRAVRRSDLEPCGATRRHLKVQGRDLKVQGYDRAAVLMMGIPSMAAWSAVDTCSAVRVRVRARVRIGLG